MMSGYFREPDEGLRSLRAFAEGMNLEDDDAALYGPEGLIANVKMILDNADGCCEESGKRRRQGWVRRRSSSRSIPNTR